uniref:Uncharacterized protein n=1 Tax=Anolis carolinensis TaxID=28377 RepID=A0A803T4G0_ANOCA
MADIFCVVSRDGDGTVSSGKGPATLCLSSDVNITSRPGSRMPDSPHRSLSQGRVQLKGLDQSRTCGCCLTRQEMCYRGRTCMHFFQYVNCIRF